MIIFQINFNSIVGVNWIHTPGSDLFIVINKLYDMSGNAVMVWCKILR